MPLTSKGNKIMEHMRSEYGDKKDKSVFYASRNAGRISGVDPESGGKPDAHKHAHRRLVHQRRAMEDHMRSQEDALGMGETEPDASDPNEAEENEPAVRKSGKRGRLDRTRKDEY